jgi:signal transduction histidine kinase
MMSRPGRAPSPLAARIVRGNLLVAVATALSLAGAATTAAHFLWQARESRRAAESARGLAETIRRESREDGTDLERAAQDVFTETALPGYRFEVWKGPRFVAGNQAGPPIGPPPLGADTQAEWIAVSVPMDGGFTILSAALREHGWRTLGLFAISFGAAAPFGLILAWVVGRRVSRHVTRPLDDLRARLLAARPDAPFPASVDPDPPVEVRDIDRAFRGLWDRLGSALAREREFAANASHELRTPLTRIRLHLERAELAEAKSEIDRMARLVQSLLVLTREVDAGLPREVINVADVCRQAVRRVFGNDGNASVDAPDEAMAHGDEELVAIAIENLLENARKFSAPGRAVDVEVTASSERVRLAVGSPGARIDAPERERVFERFHRGGEARPNADGHGLGLSLCRHIARLHGGDATCVSEPDEDARFVLELPAWRSRGAAPPASADANG